MKRNRKLGQALIEYVLLLVIPVLLISVLPSLNETVNLTLNTVGVDLMEPDEKVTPDYQPDVDKCQDGSCQVILYPPVAKFELPDNCDTKGIYRKGADIRLADISYDTDPENKGRIDKVEWTVTKYDADGNLVEECSTTHQDEVIHVSRIAGAISEVNGLTLSMDGYGGLAQYKNCIRDPGKFIVTQRVFDNDGLLSKNTHSETFEIRDLRPSIYLSVEVANDSSPKGGDFPTYVKEYSQSDSCRFDVPIGGNYNNDDLGLPDIEYSNDANVLYFDGLPYAYTEMCPRVEGVTSGKATFRIESNDVEHGNGNILKDPDFIATKNGGDDEEVPEGATTELYGYQRHGFTYKSRYIQSEALYEDDLDDSNVQIIEFDDGATTYVKEFDNAGIYLYDVQVYDENMISAQGKGVQSRNNYKPDVGVAVRVISKLDPDYLDKCDPDVPKITCPKPHYILGITKTMNNSNNKIGPYYFALGVVGKKANNSKYTESDLISIVESNKIKDENNQSIKDKFLYSVDELEEELGMEVFKTTYTYSGGNSVQIPVFRPTNDDHLSIKALTYYPIDGIQYDECKSAGSSRYWATTNGFLNTFDFQTLKSEPTAQWQPGEEKGDVWFEIQRPYDDNLQETLYYSAETIVSITQGMPLQDKNGKTIEHVELLFGMARNNLAEQDYFGGDIIASPFNGKLNSANDQEPFSGIKKKTNPDGSQSDIEIINSSIRSNGQMLAIAPILKSCPTHNLRPIPYFSYITENDDVIQLTSRVKGMDPNTGSSLIWNLDTQNPPAGITCLDEGCFVTLTAAESICGPEAQNCKINALRWKYSMYTHKPIQGAGPITESEKNNAEVLIQDDILTRYFPLSDVSNYNNQTGSAYPKYNNIFYPKGTPDAYRVTTMDDNYDRTYSLPVNNNSSGSYIYYGEYNSASEIAAEDGIKTLKTPTFDFYGKNNYSVAEIKQSGTTAPNAQETYTDLDSPDIPAGNSTPGMFLQAGTTYMYEIEVIDSQGCATSRTLTINVSDMEKEPIAMCNFIDNKVDMDDLSNYKYYGGLTVQARSSEGRTGIVYNGDVLQMYLSNEQTQSVELYTSPLYMYQRSDYNKVNTVSTDDGTQVTINENPNYFLWDYNPRLVVAQEMLERDEYNPRVGQIAAGTTSFAGILNAAHSKINKESSIEEDAETIDDIVWTAYKADFAEETRTVLTDPEYSPHGEPVEKTVNGPQEHVLGEKEKSSGVILQKLGENPTPVGVARTRHIEEFPVFPEGTFDEPGYYIIELTVAYVGQSGEKITSEPTQCKAKVTTPILDFKCPWGETFDELEKTALQTKMQVNSTTLEPTQDLFSGLSSENNQLIGNHNPNIVGFEFTTQFNNDANNKDLIETQGTPSGYETTIVDFDADKLNEFWDNLKENGYLKSNFLNYQVCTDDMVNDRPCVKINDDRSYGINALTYQIDSEKLNPLTLHVLENPSTPSWVYSQVNQNDRDYPVKPTETMTLQGWIVRERLTRDRNNVPGSAEYKPVNTPVYLASLPDDVANAELELLNKPMTDAQIDALDALLSEISSVYPELHDIKNNKFKISHMLKYTDKTKFSFIDLQPSVLQAATIKFISSDTGSLNMTDYLYTKYTGIEKVYNVNEGTEEESCVETNSIRKCNNNLSNSYGTYMINSTRYNTTSFMGKYEAAKRFQRLNYADYMNYYPGYNTDKLNPVYIGYNYGASGQEWQYSSNSVKTNMFNFKNYYIDPLSVYVNNQGLETDDGNPLNKILTTEQATSGTLNEMSSGLHFSNTLPNTLDTNSDFLLSSNQYEYNVDRTTLNNITFQHREELGRNDGTKNGASSITYIRVNAFSNQTLPNGSKNSYSKLCPVMVTATPNNEIGPNHCNIQYTTVPGNGNNILFSPNPEDGMLKDTSTGQYIVAGYDSSYPNGYNIAAHSENLKSNSLSSIDLANIHAPKSYHSTVGSKHNLADIDLDRNLVIDFIKGNANSTLETVKYSFYWQYDYSGIADLFTIDLNYRLASNPVDITDAAAVEARADDVINQFRTQFYSVYANGETKYSSRSASNKTREVRNGESITDIVWEYEKLGYKIETFDDNGDAMLGFNSTKNCGFYAARQVKLYETGTNPKKYKMEIGSWDYRVQFMSGTYAAPSKFIHWDRTYDPASGDSVLSLPEPNAYCLWTTRPYVGGGVAASYAAKQVLGRYGDETHCITSGSKHSRPAQLITEGQARAYVKEYNLVNNSNYNENKTNGTYAGFYWVDLYVTHNSSATSSEISSLCMNGEPTASSSIGNVNASGYWCRKGTMYALTDSRNVIKNLNADDVNQAIIDQNGGADSDFRAALKARTDLAYDKPNS